MQAPGCRRCDKAQLRAEYLTEHQHGIVREQGRGVLLTHSQATAKGQSSSKLKLPAGVCRITGEQPQASADDGLLTLLCGLCRSADERTGNPGPSFPQVSCDYAPAVDASQAGTQLPLLAACA